MKNANFLKKLREAKGFTQEEVAARLDYSTTTIQNWERDLKFKRPEDLHRLLDLYEVADVTRNSVVLDIYGRRSEDDVFETEKTSSGFQALKEAVEKLEGEKDVHYSLYPLDKFCTCLNVIDGRIRCLEAVMWYMEDFCLGNVGIVISGWETALLIDTIGREYGVELGAAGVYQIQEMNEKIDTNFPLGDEDGWEIFSEQFDCKMDYEEYGDALHSEIEICRSPLEVQEKAFNEIRKDWLQLCKLRERILACICMQGCWEKLVEVSGLIDVDSGLFWEIVTILRTGKSYRKTSTPERLEWFLDSKRDRLLSIDKRSKIKKRRRMDLYCDAVYQSKETVQQALHVMNQALKFMPVGYKIFNVDEWVAVCYQSELLKSRLKWYE